MTDSCCDLTQEMADSLQVDVLPLSVHFGAEVYYNWLDGREITPESFYMRIRNGEIPTTSAVNVGTFQERMHQHLSKGKDILCLCFSSALSTTYQSACIASDNLREVFPNRTIHVVDSLAASGGQGLLVYQCALLRRDGKTLEEVFQYAEQIKNKICAWFTVKDLNYLKRGGRLQSDAYFRGTMVSVKPIIHIDVDGKVALAEKVRGRRNSLSALLEHMEASVIDSGHQDVFITHGDCLEDAQYLAQKITRRFKVRSIYINYAGPVIGTHTGPGLVMLFFIGKEK